MERILSLFIGYVFGSFLTGEIVCRLFVHQSAREIGSGNPGMANIMSHVGKKEGLLTLLGDILKTALAMGLCFGLFKTNSVMHYAGLGALLGHDFTWWMKGKGGKGVTVNCTWLILGFWPYGSLSCLLGALIVGMTGWLALGAVLIPLCILPYAFKQSIEIGILCLISFLLSLYKNHNGLMKILRGEEKIKPKLKKH